MKSLSEINTPLQSTPLTSDAKCDIPEIYKMAEIVLKN